MWRLARRLAAEVPEADHELTELGALLHDIADWKAHGGDYEAGPRAARAWLASLGAPERLIGRVETLICEVSFKGLGVPTPVSSPEAALVQDADRLDALGAVGIARAFAYGGHKGRPLHDPAVVPVAHDSFESYQQSTAPTLNHFYEKLLHLPERLHTPAARRIAAGVHGRLRGAVPGRVGRGGLTVRGFGRYLCVMSMPFHLRLVRATAFGGLLVLVAAGCRICPVESCRVRKVHMHDGVSYRRQPLWKVWKKQNPAVGERIHVPGPSGSKPNNDRSKPLK